MYPKPSRSAPHTRSIAGCARTAGASARSSSAYTRKAPGSTVTFETLLETAFCHGWVDTQTKRIDDERYALRFVPRRKVSNWSDRNRQIVRRLRDEGRLTEAGIASLPADL